MAIKFFLRNSFEYGAGIWYDIGAHSDSDTKAVLQVPAAHHADKIAKVVFPITQMVCVRLARLFKPELSGDPGLIGEYNRLVRNYELAEQVLEREKEQGPGAFRLPPVYKSDFWHIQLPAFWRAFYLQGALLAIGMGGGKSKLFIDLIQNRGHKKSLIITTPSVLDEWPGQFAAHCALDDLHVLHLPQGIPVKKKAQRVYEAYRKYERLAVIVNYESSWRGGLGPVKRNNRIVDQGVLLSHKWDFVGLDEGQHIADLGSAQTRFIHRLGMRAPYRAIATASAMRQRPIDLFSLLRFCDAGAAGRDFKKFADNFCIYNPNEMEAMPDGTVREKPPERRYVVGYKNLPQFHQLFRSISYYAEPNTIDLPKPLHIPRHIYLPNAAMTEYRRMHKEFVAYVRAVGEQTAIEAPNTLSRMLRLEQICSGFLSELEADPDTGKTRVKDLHPLHTAKRDELVELLRNIDADEPVVVATRFKYDLEQVEAAATIAGRACFMHGGDTRREKDQWAQASGGQVLAGSIAAICEGTNNLVRARYGVCYSIGYSITQIDQFFGRLFRPGQTRQPIFYHIAAAGLIDDKKYAAIAAGKEIIAEIVRGTGRAAKSAVG